MKTRITKLINEISEGLYEREEIIALSLLSVLSGQSVFLYGPPGTAKSLVARRVSMAFKDAKFFETLMHKFSTPDELFGPISLDALKKDEYTRKVDNYLPTADIAFLDEIWKSGPAVLNTLLTIINERIYHSGCDVKKVPLKGLIAASNEFPMENGILEALYDRFIVRLQVNPLAEKEHFESLLKNELSEVSVSKDLVLSNSEYEELIKKSKLIEVSQEVLNIVHCIRLKIDEFNKNEENEPIYISDRRWQKMMVVLKTAAYLCGRQTVMPVDAFILKNTLWTKIENKDKIAEIVENAVREFTPYYSEKYAQWFDEFEGLMNESLDVFFESDDVFNVEEIEGKKYIPIVIENFIISNYSAETTKLFIPLKAVKKTNNFDVFDANGKKIDKVTVNFKGTYTALINNSRGYNKQSFKIEIVPIRKKIDCKKITPRIKNNYKKDVDEKISELKKIQLEIQEYYEEKKLYNGTPFVNKNDQAVPIVSVEEYLKELDASLVTAEKLKHDLECHKDEWDVNEN